MSVGGRVRVTLIVGVAVKVRVGVGVLVRVRVGVDVGVRVRVGVCVAVGTVYDTCSFAPFEVALPLNVRRKVPLAGPRRPNP